MFRFANIEYLYLLILLPVLALIFALVFRQRKMALKRFGDPQVIGPLMPYASYSRPVIKAILVLLALTCLVFGIARPQFGSKLREIKREGVPL